MIILIVYVLTTNWSILSPYYNLLIIFDHYINIMILVVIDSVWLFSLQNDYIYCDFIAVWSYLGALYNKYTNDYLYLLYLFIILISI